jgi:hypothetical protein
MRASRRVAQCVLNEVCQRLRQELLVAAHDDAFGDRRNQLVVCVLCIQTVGVGDRLGHSGEVDVGEPGARLCPFHLGDAQ